MGKIINQPNISWETTREGLLVFGGNADLFEQLMAQSALKSAIENAFDGVKIHMRVRSGEIEYWLDLSAGGDPVTGVKIVGQSVVLAVDQKIEVC